MRYISRYICGFAKNLPMSGRKLFMSNWCLKGRSERFGDLRTKIFYYELRLNDFRLGQTFKEVRGNCCSSFLWLVIKTRRSDPATQLGDLRGGPELDILQLLLQSGLRTRLTITIISYQKYPPWQTLEIWDTESSVSIPLRFSWSWNIQPWARRERCEKHKKPDTNTVDKNWTVNNCGFTFHFLENFTARK